jgi:hypothetical protein
MNSSHCWLIHPFGRTIQPLRSTRITRFRRYYGLIRPCATHRDLVLGKRTVLPAGSSRRRPLHVRPLPLGGSVIQGEGKPLGVGDQRLDRRHPGRSGGDAVGLLAGGRNDRGARSEPIAELGGAD